MTYRRGDYAQPPCDKLDEAVIALGMIIEAADLPDEEPVIPVQIPNRVRRFGDDQAQAA